MARSSSILRRQALPRSPSSMRRRRDVMADHAEGRRPAAAGTTDPARERAIDAFLTALPRRAQRRIAARALPFVQSRRRVFVIAFVFCATAVIAGVILVVFFDRVALGTAAWLAAIIGYGAGLAVARTWRTRMLRDNLRRFPADWVLTPCPVCDYDQTGNESNRCPECGCPVRITG
jgi:hypothetical protein